MSELPSGWAATTISAVTAPFVSIDPAKLPDQPFRYVDIGAIDNKSLTITAPKSFPGRDAPTRARRVIQAGDTLFSTVRTHLKNIALVPDELDGELTSTGIAVLRPNEAIDPDYLFRWASSDPFVNELSGTQDGTMYPAVSDKDVARATIPLPPLPEQRRIVTKIDSLTGKSSRARDRLARIPRLVEKYKRALAHQVIHSREWTYIPFLEACDAYQPGSFSKSQLIPDGQYAVYGANGIIGRYDKYSHENPQLLITCRGATCGSVNISQPFSWITRNAMVVDGTKGGLTLAFLRAYFAEGFDFSSVISGSAQPQITRQNLARLQMPVVSLIEQQAIVHRIESAFAWIDRLAADATSARKLIDHLDRSILAKAFRGELVPQDPADESAATVLARIHAERTTAPQTKQTWPRAVQS